MGRALPPADDDVVSLASDSADTVVWFTGPVEYDEAHLSADLVADLRAWEHFFLDHEVSGRYTVDTSAMPHYRQEGIRLARALAKEIGSGFAVEFDPDEQNSAPRRFRSADTATNPAAARAFVRRQKHNDLDGDWAIRL